MAKGKKKCWKCGKLLQPHNAVTTFVSTGIGWYGIGNGSKVVDCCGRCSRQITQRTGNGR